MNNTNCTASETSVIHPTLDDYRFFRDFLNGLLNSADPSVSQSDLNEVYERCMPLDILDVVQDVCKEHNLSLYDLYCKNARTSREVFYALKHARHDAEMHIHMFEGGTLD